MTVYAPGPDARERTHQSEARRQRQHRMRDDLAQLTQPYTIPVRQRGRRMRRTRWTAVTHPPLLDQLRHTAAGQLQASHRGPERRRIPDSADPPGWRPDASQRLGDIRANIGAWRDQLGLTRHLLPAEWDTCRRCLTDLGRQHLDPDTADLLARDVRRWWSWAARQTGWTTDELETIR